MQITRLREASIALILTTTLFFAFFVSDVFAQGITSLVIHDDDNNPLARRRHRPRPRFRPVTIDKHLVRVGIENDVAKTTIEQVFRNPNTVMLEGTYLFPVPGERLVDRIHDGDER